MLRVAELDWGLWLTTMAPLIFSAGPGNIMVAASGARSGLRGSLPFIIGLDTTYLLLALAFGLGLGRVLTEYPSVALTLHALGVSYIFFLAFRFLVQRPTKIAAPSDGFSVLNGVVVQLTNTKGMIMLMVMFGEFAGPKIGGITPVVVMSSVLVCLNFLAHLIWGAFGEAMNAAFIKHAFLFRIQNYIFAIMLCAVGVWLAIR